MHTRSVTTHALSVLATGLILALGLVLVPGQARAQDMAMAAHPAHIHSGTCAELGDVVFPLSDVTMDMGTPEASPMAGEDMGTPVSDMAMGSPEAGMDALTSETIVQAALSDILGAPHAINVHESAENIANYIACGDVTGEATGEELSVELTPLNDSGYSGSAMLRDNGDGTTTVKIMLMQDGM
jgi:hypothetical protein